MKHAAVMIRSFLLIINTFSLFNLTENTQFYNLEYIYNNHQFLFFTKVSQSLAILTAILGIIHRTTGKVGCMRNFFIPVSFSFEFIVTTIYWGMYFIDERLIVDGQSVVYGYKTPMISRISSHLLPLILAYLEKMDFKIWPSKYHPIFIGVFGCAYFSLITLYSMYFGRYVYPFLDQMGVFHKTLFFMVVSAIGAAGYFLTFKI